MLAELALMLLIDTGVYLHNEMNYRMIYIKADKEKVKYVDLRDTGTDEDSKGSVYKLVPKGNRD